MWCRYFLYIFGFFLFFVTLGCFLLWVLMSFTSVISYSGCNYFENTISSPTQFTKSFQRLGTDSTVASQFSVCLNGQSGNLVNSVSGSQNSAFLTNMQSTVAGILNFNGLDMSNSINKGYEPLKVQLASYSQSQTLDLSNTRAINDLKYVSNSQNYATCQNGNFQSDSWIPNIAMKNNQIPCLSPKPHFYADRSTCPNAFSFIQLSTGCIGCIGTASMLSHLNSNVEAFAYLNARYTDCPQFSTDLSNIWSNYYLVKTNTLSPVIARQATARKEVFTLNEDLSKTVNPIVASTVTGLYASFGSLVDPTYGVLSGLNCGVIGEDLTVFKAALCQNTFSYSYFHRILMMVISMCLAFLLCCNTCVLFRKKRDIFNAIYYPSDDENDRRNPRGEQNNPYLARAAPLTDERLRNGRY